MSAHKLACMNTYGLCEWLTKKGITDFVSHIQAWNYDGQQLVALTEDQLLSLEISEASKKKLLKSIYPNSTALGASGNSSGLLSRFRKQKSTSVSGSIGGGSAAGSVPEGGELEDYGDDEWDEGEFDDDEFNDGYEHSTDGGNEGPEHIATDHAHPTTQGFGLPAFPGTNDARPASGRAPGAQHSHIEGNGESSQPARQWGAKHEAVPANAANTRSPRRAPPPPIHSTVDVGNGAASHTSHDRGAKQDAFSNSGASHAPSPQQYGGVPDLMNQEYYNPSMDRRGAQEVLQAAQVDGSFVVRNSSKVAGEYSLSLLYQGHIRHLRIRRRAHDSTFALGEQKPGEKFFSNVVELIMYHKTEPINLQSGGFTILTYGYR